jgi:hypothetical protein
MCLHQTRGYQLSEGGIMSWLSRIERGRRVRTVLPFALIVAMFLTALVRMWLL